MAIFNSYVKLPEGIHDDPQMMTSKGNHRRSLKMSITISMPFKSDDSTDHPIDLSLGIDPFSLRRNYRIPIVIPKKNPNVPIDG